MEMEQGSSAFSRKIVNLFAAMAAGHPELPRVLAERGYKAISIERPFYAQPGKQVTPELTLASEKTTHTLLIEAKSGANLEEGQLSRYALVTSQALLDAQFPPAATSSHNLVIVGKEEFGARLLIGSKRLPDAKRVMLLVTPKGLAHNENSFSDEELSLSFSPELILDWDVVPTSYLPVDHESELWEFAAYLFPELVAAILRDSRELSLDEAAKSFIRHWALISPAYQNRLKAKIEEALTRGIQIGFSRFLSYTSTSRTTGKVLITVPDDLKGKHTKLTGILATLLRRVTTDFESPQLTLPYRNTTRL